MFDHLKENEQHTYTKNRPELLHIPQPLLLFPEENNKNIENFQLLAAILIHGFDSIRENGSIYFLLAKPLGHNRRESFSYFQTTIQRQGEIRMSTFSLKHVDPMNFSYHSTTKHKCHSLKLLETPSEDYQEMQDEAVSILLNFPKTKHENTKLTKLM